jgi:hypothetical protein
MAGLTQSWQHPASSHPAEISMFEDQILLKQLATFVISTAVTSLFVFLAGRWTRLGPLPFAKIFVVVAALNFLLIPICYFIPQLNKPIPGLVVATFLYIFGFGKFLVSDNGIARYKKGAELVLAMFVITLIVAVALFVVILLATLVLSASGSSSNLPKIG